MVAADRKVNVPALSIAAPLAFASMLSVPVTLMLPVPAVLRVPVRDKSLAVAIVIVPSFVTVRPSPLPTEVFAHCTPLPVKLSVAPDPVKFDNCTVPVPEPANAPE